MENYTKTYVEQYIESDLDTEKENFKRTFANRDTTLVESGTMSAHVDGLADTLNSIGHTFPEGWQGQSRNEAIGFIWQVAGKSNDFDLERRTLITELGQKRRALFSAVSTWW